jgi:DNA repair photolyase
MRDPREPVKGRGANLNPQNRFEEVSFIPDYEYLEYAEEDFPSPQTKFYKDATKTILTKNDSPDIPFTFTVNPYRGCEHGCSYCYARPTHEYLGLSGGIDFETKIFVKEKAPELLTERLMAPSWKPEPIIFSGVTDCYQPAERRFRLTRQCLEVLAKFKNPVSIITKNALVTRDLDVFQQLNEFQGIAVMLSVTTLDEKLCGLMEPRTSRPEARLRAIETLAKAGIKVGVNVAPVIPGLTEHEMPKILEAAANAGATSAGYIALRLPWSVLPVFTHWVEQHFPDRKEKILSHIREFRGGELNDSNFGSRMRGQGLYANNLNQMFHIYCKRYGLNQRDFNLNSSEFKRPTDQLSLF